MLNYIFSPSVSAEALYFKNGIGNVVNDGVLMHINLVIGLVVSEIDWCDLKSVITYYGKKPQQILIIVHFMAHAKVIVMVNYVLLVLLHPSKVIVSF